MGKFLSFFSILLLLMMVIPALGQLQTQPYNLYYPQNTANIGFSQEFNSYIWNYNLATKRIQYNKWSVRMIERYRTSLLKISSNENKWKDDQQLTFDLQYQLLPTLSLQSLLSSIVFLDKQSGFNNDIKTHTNLFAATFQPNYNTSARLGIGPKLDNRYNQHDNGMTYTFQANVGDLQWEEYNNSIDFHVTQDQFKTRKNSDFNFGYQMQRQFIPGTADSLYAFTTNRRRDNYASVDGNVESYRENIKGVENQLRYGLGETAHLNFNTSLQFKNVEVQNYVQEQVERRRKRNDVRLSNDLSLFVKKRRLYSNIILSYWNQEQKYDIAVEQANVPFSNRTAFVTPNNASDRVAIQSRVDFRFNQADSVHSYFSISKFKYDTPDTNNFDDRDELRINSIVSYSHFFSPYLRLQLNAGVNLYHMVYIFGERSADNNWNRIFRLKPAVIYKPSQQFRFSQAFEVLANYVDYDFDGENVATKSFVFRKFAMDDSLQLNMTKNLSIWADYRLQLEENGQLSWDQWTERILVTRRNNWLHFYLRYSVREQFALSPGYSFYVREEWRHKTDLSGNELREKLDPFKSHGPVLRFIYSPHYRLRLVLDANRYAVEPPGQITYYNNDIALNLYWIF